MHFLVNKSGSLSENEISAKYFLFFTYHITRNQQFITSITFINNVDVETNCVTFG